LDLANFRCEVYDKGKYFILKIYCFQERFSVWTPQTRLHYMNNFEDVIECTETCSLENTKNEKHDIVVVVKEDILIMTVKIKCFGPGGNNYWEGTYFCKGDLLCENEYGKKKYCFTVSEICQKLMEIE